MIEASVLVFFFCYRERGYGLYHLIPWLKKDRVVASADVATDGARPVSTNTVDSRREALKNLAVLPVLGLFAWGAWRRTKTFGVDTLSGATID